MTFSRADHVYDNDVVVICRLLCFSFRSIYICIYISNFSFWAGVESRSKWLVYSMWAVSVYF